MPYVGIDFGTSNSVVANFRYGQAEVLPNREGLKWTPSVVTVRDTLVAMFLAVTVAPGMPAPCGSKIVPTMRPAWSWADAERGSTSRVSRTVTMRTAIQSLSAGARVRARWPFVAGAHVVRTPVTEKWFRPVRNPSSVGGADSISVSLRPATRTDCHSATSRLR